MPVLMPEKLKKLSLEILKAAGTPQERAEVVAEILIWANLRGVDSHGARHVSRYVSEIKKGSIVPDSEISIIKETPTTALWDANNSFGFVVAKKAIETAVEMAKKNKLGSVGTINSKKGDDHIGALAYYAEIAAMHDMIGIVACSNKSWVAPYGGTTRVLSINPLAISIPALRNPPIILDMSTTHTSRGHLDFMMKRGETIPEGWLIDKAGKPTNKPEAIAEGGAFLPFGGYKGYGISVIIEAIVGGLGSGVSQETIGRGHIYMAIDPSGFVPIQEFKASTDRLIEHLKASPPAKGVEEVFVPGEIENKTFERRLQEGIPVDDIFWQSIMDTAKELGVDPDKVIE